MLDQGLCDISIEISHLENETQANTPETLLERVLKAVPYGDMACPRLNLALGIPAGTITATSRIAERSGCRVADDGELNINPPTLL